MKTCFRNPIGLLAGFTLSLMPLAANAQEDRPMPPPPADRPAMRDQGPIPNPRIQRQRVQMDMQRRMGMRQEAIPMRDGEPRRQRTMKEPKPEATGPRAKVRHLMQAAEHLQAAGYQEYADKARKEAGSIMEQARKDSAKEANPELTEKVNALARQVEELRQQIRRMNAAPKAPKESNEIEELRQQIRRMKAEMAPKPPKDRGDRPAERPADGQPQ